MANNPGGRGPPPPPPPPGGAVPNQFQRQGAVQQQGPFRQGPAQNVQVFNPPRVSDIRPQVVLTEDYSRQQLTAYEVLTLRKAPPLPDDGLKGPKRSQRPKPNWERVTVLPDVFDREDIIRKIRSLDRNSRPVTTKKASLFPNQHAQVTKILEEKNGTEPDPGFIWTLAQLERKEIISKKTGNKETDTLTLFLKRSLRPELNATVVFQNFERAKLQQSRPPQQMREPVINEQFQGQTQPRPQPGRFPPNEGRRVPAEVHQVQERRRSMGQDKAGDKFGAKGKKDDIVEVIEIHGEKQSRKYDKNGRKDRRNHSDDSSSNRSSDSDTDSESDAVYTDSETDPSSASSSRRIRRDSGIHRKGTPIPRRQHEKGYVILETPRRRAHTAYAPDPPHRRAYSHERSSLGSIGIEPAVTEAFAAGVIAATKASLGDRLPITSPRTIMYPDDRSPRSLDDEFRAFERYREGLRLPEDLGLRDGIRTLDELSRRESLRQQEVLRQRERHRESLRLQEELRLRDDIRAQEDRIEDDFSFAEEALRRDSMPSPRTRDPIFHRRSSLSPLPLDSHRTWEYVRNPFERRRTDPLYPTS